MRKAYSPFNQDPVVFFFFQPKSIIRACLAFIPIGYIPFGVYYLFSVFITGSQVSCTPSFLNMRWSTSLSITVE